MLIELLIDAAAIAVVALIAWCWQPAVPEPAEATDEFRADFDAIAHEPDELAKSRARCRASEQAINNLKGGPGQHDGREL